VGAGLRRAQAERLERGRGTVVREEGDVVVVCTGPVLASQAYGVEDAALVLLPWLRDVDGAWLAEVAAGRRIVVLDNHWVRGGQGDAVRAALPDREVEIIGIDRIPEHGGNDEVLRAHGLDTSALRERLRA
jgi:transketolase C-terminal domain/subunit